ncbi:MAG: 2-polyprenylphenol 6-hydroxylase [Deltaproteobacteria bacterium]|nr:2-polyprenylphenol 6-hydroxylase [Deltaproteobacteria bacterium]
MIKYHAIRDILRIKTILTTLVRYGFGGFVSELRLLPFFSTFKRVFTPKSRESVKNVPTRIRLVLEELGPTFIKLGQVASTRADLFPAEWIEEFKKLQDDLPPTPFVEIKKRVEDSLGAPISKLFQSFDETSAASASIAQVHYATLPGGIEVAVKIKRPGIDNIIAADISVMYTFARLLVKHVKAARRYRPIKVVDEFARSIQNELDLTVEGANATRFGKIFKGSKTVQIPKVYWEYSSSSVLTLERIYGIPLDEVEKIKAMGLDIKAVAKNAAQSFFTQVFDHGFFHADLHPGNIFVRDDGAVIYLDFGIIGRLNKELRSYLASILFYLLREDYRKVAKLHRQMGLIGKDVDIIEFEDALRDLAEPIFDQPLKKIEASAMLLKLLETAKRFDMTLQPGLLLLQKSMIIIEGVGRQLCPDVNMWDEAKPVMLKWMIKEKASPLPYIKKGRELTEEIATNLLALPEQINSLLGTTLSKELKIGFVHYRLGSLASSLLSAGKKISMAIIVSMLLFVSTLTAIFPINKGSEAITVLGVPALSLIGVMLALLLGVRIFHNKKDDPLIDNYGDDDNDNY